MGAATEAPSWGGASQLSMVFPTDLATVFEEEDETQ